MNESKGEKGATGTTRVTTGTTHPRTKELQVCGKGMGGGQWVQVGSGCAEKVERGCRCRCKYRYETEFAGGLGCGLARGQRREHEGQGHTQWEERTGMGRTHTRVSEMGHWAIGPKISVGQPPAVESMHNCRNPPSVASSTPALAGGWSGAASKPRGILVRRVRCTKVAQPEERPSRERGYRYFSGCFSVRPDFPREMGHGERR